MESNEFKSLISLAEKLREKEGKHSKALEVFGEALEKSQTTDQKAEAMAQIGLTHWHDKDFDKAREKFEELLEFGEAEKNDGAIAMAHRNLSRPEITVGGKLQLEHSKKAYDFAKSAGRKDLIWFSHGVVNSALINGFVEEATEWLKVEEREFLELENNPEEIKNDNDIPLIWKTGYLMDKGRIENSRETLEEALRIAKDNSLVLRAEQIERILEDF